MDPNTRMTHGSAEWLAAYRSANADRLRDEPGFANWLETEYVPIAGGWQY
jgi:hypothetical protein